MVLLFISIGSHSPKSLSHHLCPPLSVSSSPALSPPQSQPRGLTEETGWTRPGWATEETTRSLPHPEGPGRGAEGWGFWPDLWVGCWKRRSGQQGPPQTLWFGHGPQGENNYLLNAFLQVKCDVKLPATKCSQDECWLPCLPTSPWLSHVLTKTTLWQKHFVIL